MDRQILNFTANEQALTVDEPIKISTNKVNYIEAHFDLGQNWSGYDSVRAIWWNDFQTISTVLDSQGVTSVPFEVMKRKGCVKVNLVGSISENDVLTDRLTSYPVVAVIVDCTAQITGANTQPITPSEYEQFVAAVHDDADRAEQGATDAQGYASDAQGYAQDASDSAQSAHDDKIAIEQAIAEVIQQIEDFEQVQVVVNTLPPSSQATSDFTDGVLTLGIPQGVKGDTGNGIQSIAKVSTSGLVDTYRITYTNGQTTTFTVTNGAKGDTGNGIQSIAKTSTVGLVDTYTITYTDGNTTTFTVTNGEKGDKGDTGEVSLSELEDATIVQTLSDNEPYHFRRTNNGQGSGHREYDEIVGASVGWNQLVQNGNFADTSGWSGTTYVSISVSDGKLTASSTTDSNRGWYIKRDGNLPASHKLLILAKVKNLTSGTRNFSISDNGAKTLQSIASDTTVNVEKIYVPTSDLAMIQVGFSTFLTASGTNGIFEIENFMIIDLTLALGSTIADYIYSLEQANAGAGVSYFRSLFPKPYYAYNAGELLSVSGLQSHDMVGFNAFDKSTATDGKYVNANGNEVTDATRGHSDFIKVIPSTKYHMKGYAGSGYYSILAHDADKNIISGFYSGASKTDEFSATLPSNCHYVILNYMLTQKNTMCFNISWDGERDGEYEPYTVNSYPLDDSLTLRGIPKLDASNNLYYDGDTYESDGTVTRKYGIVDLGTLNWSLYNTVFHATLTGIAHGKSLINIVSDRYVTEDATSSVGSGASWNDKTVRGNSGTSEYIYIKDTSYSSASDFKTAMSGIYLVYELYTPTTESATPYDNPQWCDANGTEEYVSDCIVPIGHNTKYPMTLVDTMPNSNGTYEPRVTIANGKRTITWQSV